jgi:peptide chain release factor 1
MIKNILRWYKFSPLTLSIAKHLKPYQEQYTKINHEIIALSTNTEQFELLTSLQIKSSTMQNYVALANSLDSIMDSLADLDLLRKDREMAEIVEQEIEEKENELNELEENILDLILEKDADDSSNVIVEIKPGVGGSESSLFSEDIYNMYLAFAETMRWNPKVIHLSQDIQINKGIKEVVFKLEGRDVYSLMKYESGVHKVIRVPETEKAGRLHSSTACVIVLPDHPPVFGI